VTARSTDVHYSAEGGLATITLDGPSSRNALAGTTVQGLGRAVEQAAQDSVRALLITGVQGAFSAGADLRELGSAYADDQPPDLGDLLRRGLNPVITLLAELPKPVIAAIGGPAVGAGMALALACDLRLAGRSATLSTAFTGLGLTGDAGMSWTLPRIVGPARAAALMLLPERIPAERALELGLVHAVLPDDLLGSSATELADRLANGPTAAYAAVKRTLAASASTTLRESLELEAAEQAALGWSADHRAAVTAFLTREPPTFSGH
jgi:2-(1,2-epoxy-1,2-dihydrophenyl)acetyl-CoA isomerase